MHRQQSNRVAVGLFILGTAVWPYALLSAQGAGQSASAEATPGATAPSVIERYCAGCHNGRMRSPSGVLLDQFDATQISSRPDLWVRAYRQLQAGTMPPSGAA